MRLPNNLCKDNRFQIRVVGMHSCTTSSFTMKSCLVHVSFLPLTSVAFPPLRNGWGGRNCLFFGGGRDGRSGCNGWGEKLNGDED